MGFAVWNIEYRRVGRGGGVPETLEDVARAIDFVPKLPVDRGALIVCGHSAGGHLAMWAASRSKLGPAAPGGPPRLVLDGAISLAGVVDLDFVLESGDATGAVTEFVGGDGTDRAARLSVAAPLRNLPFGVPTVLFHGIDDRIVSPRMSERFAETARASGDASRFVGLPGAGHSDLIRPRGPAFSLLVQALHELARSQPTRSCRPSPPPAQVVLRQPERRASGLNGIVVMTGESSGREPMSHGDVEQRESVEFDGAVERQKSVGFSAVTFELTDQIKRHLLDDRVVWLTTVSPTGRPMPRPVWFFWDGSHILIYSLNTAARLANIRANANVSVHFNSTVEGEDAVELSAVAEIVGSPLLPSANALYMAKYGRDIEEAPDFDLESVDREYDSLIRIAPIRSWSVA
jgi:PPOX class probable F420-dependent enzyme